MAVFSYHTIQSVSEGLYKEKGSKFLSFAYPVETEDEIKQAIDALKKEYFDARHHCFAYVLGPDKKTFRAFDDREPNHSAGDPILGQIRSKDLTNLLVVVVRYFGGVKLGVGGLITAYKSSAQNALDNAVIIEKEVLHDLTLTYEYSATLEVMRLIKEFELIVKEQSFQRHCVLLAQYKLKYGKPLFEKIQVLKATGHSIEISAS